MNVTETVVRFLMCQPDHFAVSYAINPWMEPERWTRNAGNLAAASRREWDGLVEALRGLGADVELVPAMPGLPDLVFTANAAVVLDGKALLARFRPAERRREEAHFEAALRALQARGLIDWIGRLPEGIVLEGAGDCVWDRTRNLFWLGYGQRSDAASAQAVEAAFGVEAVALELADARFYHMDTALCPLPGGEVMYWPGAFTAEGRAAIRARVAPAQRIELGFEDAASLSANAVCVGETVMLSACGDRLRTELKARGYRPIEMPLGAFLRSGGAGFCLTLRLDLRSAAAQARATETAA